MKIKIEIDEQTYLEHDTTNEDIFFIGTECGTILPFNIHEFDIAFGIFITAIYKQKEQN